MPGIFWIIYQQWRWPIPGPPVGIIQNHSQEPWKNTIKSQHCLGKATSLMWRATHVWMVFYGFLVTLVVLHMLFEPRVTSISHLYQPFLVMIDHYYFLYEPSLLTATSNNWALSIKIDHWPPLTTIDHHHQIDHSSEPQSIINQPSVRHQLTINDHPR